MTVASDDEAEARRVSASRIAWYLCAMGDVYARSVTEQGYGGAVDLAMIGLPPGLPWAIIEATLRAAAP